MNMLNIYTLPYLGMLCQALKNKVEKIESLYDFVSLYLGIKSGPPSVPQIFEQLTCCWKPYQ